MVGRIAAAVFLGDRTQSSRSDLEKVINEFNSELSHFGHSIGFQIFDRVQGIRLNVIV